MNAQGGGRGSDITLTFIGQDRTLVTAAAERLVAQMKKFPELADVYSSASAVRPEIQIRPRPDEAARLGVSAADIASAARIATNGDVDQNLAKFNLLDRQIPIRVLLRPDSRSDLETIKALRVRTATATPFASTRSLMLSSMSANPPCRGAIASARLQSTPTSPRVRSNHN